MKQSLRLKLKPSPRQQQKLYQVGVAASFAAVIATLAILFNIVSTPKQSNANALIETANKIEGYYNRMELTIGYESQNLSGTQLNFPFLFDKQIPELCTEKNNGFIQTADASDVLFTKEDGTTIIPHQIERYNSTKGRLIAWLGLDTFTVNHPKKIFVYYGSKIKKANQTEVFPKSYTSVYHLNADFFDATKQSNKVDFSGVTDEEGIIAGAKSWSASYQSESCIENEETDYFNFTYSCWINPNHTTVDQIIASSKNEKAGFRIFIDKKGQISGELMDTDGNSNICKKSSVKLIQPKQWQHIVLTYQAQSGLMSMYVNGEIVSTSSAKLNKISLKNLCIGSDAYKTAGSFNGLIDECRLSKVPFTTDRIRLEFANQLHPVKFFMSDKPNNLTAELADMVSFDADIQTSHVVINWSTRFENKLDFFVLEKSKDGQNFEKVDVKFASGFQNQSVKNYYLIDAKPFEGFSYYRLKMIGFGGKTALSHIIHVSFHPKNEGFNVQTVEPNPFNKNFKVTLLSNENNDVGVKLTSVSGQLILEDKIKMNAGEATDFTFEDKNNLRPGMYFLSFSQNNQNQTVRLVKQAN